jgi:hypothetical protein
VLLQRFRLADETTQNSAHAFLQYIVPKCTEKSGMAETSMEACDGWQLMRLPDIAQATQNRKWDVESRACLSVWCLVRSLVMIPRPFSPSIS